MEDHFFLNKERIQGYLKNQYFMSHIGFMINKVEWGRIEGNLELKNIHKQQKGFAHGGLIATLADIVSGFAAYTVVSPEIHVVTAELKISYLNPGVGESLHAIGWVLKSGKKINFCEAEIYSENQGKRTLIAKSSATMANVFPDDYQ
jgi:uncharacterized protein (TIGR00369 family)